MFDGATFGGYLQELELASRAAGRRVGVIIAKRHGSWRADHHGQFDSDFLPPNSLELNPIERVGKQTRRNSLPNGCFPQLALGTETVEKAIRSMGGTKLRTRYSLSPVTAVNYVVKIKWNWP